MKFDENFKIVPIDAKKTLRIGQIRKENYNRNRNRKLIMTESQLKQLLLRYL